MSEPKLPPVYIPGLREWNAMLETVSNNTKNKEFTYKIINQYQMKLKTPLIAKRITYKNLREIKVAYHTYQMKKDKAWYIDMCITQ